MNFKKKYIINPDIVFREEEQGAFLFNPETDELRCINKTGASICRRCNGKNNMDKICLTLFEEYDVSISAEKLKEDIKTFINELIDLYILKEPE